MCLNMQTFYLYHISYDELQNLKFDNDSNIYLEFELVYKSIFHQHKNFGNYLMIKYLDSQVGRSMLRNLYTPNENVILFQSCC